MTTEHWKKLSLSSDTKRIKFISHLLLIGLPLSAIDTNDWQANLKPSVYVHNLYNKFVLRRYYRCSEGDTIKAVNFYNQENATGIQ